MDPCAVPPHAVLAVELALLDEVREHLADEEGVAVGLVADGLDEVGVHVLLGERREERADLCLVEPLEEDALVLDLAPQRAQGVGERMLAVELDVPVGAENEQPVLLRPSRDVPHHRDGALVRPVDVIKEQEQRDSGARAVQELRDGIEQPKALLVGLQRFGFGDAFEPVAQRRHEAGDRGGARPQVLAQLIEAGVPRIAFDRLGEGAVGRGPIALEAAAPQHAAAARLDPFGELLGRARLADAGLADEHDEAAVAGLRVVEERVEAGDLGGAADERRAREEGVRFVALELDLAGVHRIGDALELERPEIAERERLASGEHVRDGGAAPDLAGRGGVAQPARDDDRRAEQVALVTQGIADVEADADREVLAGDGAARGLLHVDGAAHGVGGGVEGDHEAVAERLHLGPAVGGDGLAQDLVVGLEDALGVLVPGALHELGGVHEVGEEDGDRLGVCGHLGECSTEAN